MTLRVATLVFLAASSFQIQCRLQSISNSLVTSRKSLAQCVGVASSIFFKEDKISVVSLSILENKEYLKSPIPSDELLFYELFNENNLTVVVKKTTKSDRNEKYYNEIGNYIIQFRQPEELRQNLNVLRNYPTWNSQAKFMVISSTAFNNPSHVAEQVIVQLWVHKIVQGVVILKDTSVENNYVVYSWMPFSESRCKSGFQELQTVDYCKFGNFNKSINWFPNKIPINLNGCKIKTRAVIWPPYVVASTENPNKIEGGVEVKLLQTMAQIANFTIEYGVSDVEQDWGSVYNNGTSTGAFLTLRNEEYDIAIGSFAGTTERHRYLDAVAYNIVESLTWCVSHAEDTEQWKKLLMVIPTSVWYFCMIILFIISLCLWKLAHLTGDESTSYKSLISSMQNSFSVLVNMTVKTQPRTLKVRLLFLLWAYFTLHIAVLYQSTLISVLTKPKYEQQIKTIFDILDKNLNLWVLVNNNRYFREEADFVSTSIRNKAQVCPDIDDCLRDTAFNQTSATCTPRLHMKFIVNQYVTKKGRPLLYCFQDIIVTYPLEMYVTKGFPLRTYFSQLVNRITAAGLIAHWEKEIFDAKLRKVPIYQTAQIENDYKLTLVQLELIFIILLIGHTAAFLAFIIELYVHSRKQSRF